MAEVKDRELHRLGIERTANVAAHGGAELSAESGGDGSGDACEQRCSGHLHARSHQQVERSLLGAQVQDPGGDGGDGQRAHHVNGQKQADDQQFEPIGLEEVEDQLHEGYSFLEAGAWDWVRAPMAGAKATLN